MFDCVKIVAQEAPRFDINDPNQASEMMKYLDTHGYTVVKGAASNEDIQKAKDSFWDYWEGQSRKGILKRDDPSTWGNWMANAATGIMLTSQGANHSDFHWNARTLPTVRKAFEYVWNCNKLIVSYDAGGVFRPWTHNIRWLTNGGWWHVDQNASLGPHRQGRVTVQGLVTYYDATAETGGLCVIPGSHLHHDEVCSRAPGARLKHDYVPVHQNEPLLQAATGETVEGKSKQTGILVCAKAGDLILWDSRTIHCNTPALSMVDHFAKQLMNAKISPPQLELTPGIPSGTSSADHPENSENKPLSLPAVPDPPPTHTAAVPPAGTAVVFDTATNAAAASTYSPNQSAVSEIAQTFPPLAPAPASVPAPAPAAASPAPAPVPVPVPAPTLSPPDLLRLVAYVCMVPRAHASAKVMRNRKQAFLLRLPSPHFPTYEFNDIEHEKLEPWCRTRSVLELVGYTDQEIVNIEHGVEELDHRCTVS
jgi:hypothetical protein